MSNRHYLHSQSSCLQLDDSVNDVVRLWMLRALVPLGGHKKFVNAHGCSDVDICEVLGMDIESLEGAADEPFKTAQARRELRRLHRAAEHLYAQQPVPVILQRNVARLASVIGLNNVECRVLELVALLYQVSVLESCTETLGDLTSTGVVRVLAGMLALPAPAVKQVLSKQGVLARTGIVQVDAHPYKLRHKLNVLSAGFVEALVEHESDPVELVRDRIIPAAAPNLQIEDYAHLDDLAVLKTYLGKALQTGKPGVNIYLHGSPGTGKTQLARVLAQELGVAAFEVTTENSDGDPVNAISRLRAVRAAQSFLSNAPCVLVFDEAEDVFNNSGFMQESTAKQHKGWFNQMLESNPLPTLWLSNAARGLDASFVRRFDMIVEVAVPPKARRLQILQAHCNGLADTATLAKLANSAELSPAIVQRAASVARCVQAELGDNKAQKALVGLMSQTLKMQGLEPLNAAQAVALPECYDPRYINVDADLQQLCEGIRNAPSARICIWGPPGTGKTAYGRWLAQQLERNLLVKRVSDLVSPYLGETEQKIARAFQEARQDKAVLVIDEVDGFLQDRRGAQRSWEVTQVNEMLTQMEQFDGIFIASTNLMEGLDQAALRRFDLKIKFDYLLPEQAQALFQAYCTQHGLAAPPTDVLNAIGKLHNLTPGDFAAVARRSRFSKLTDAAAWLEALRTECAVKQGGARPRIGFVH